MRQNKVSGISIGNPGNPWIKGLMELLPPGYNPADMTTKYPVIIYFHGVGGRGEGTTTDLCAMICDAPTSLPGRIEEGTAQESVVFNGQTYNYIIISPQYRIYDYPGNIYPSANAVDSVIDYVLANYRVDPKRVYLTGMSSGANMVNEFASNSVARASRVAAVNPASLCSRVGVTPNGPNAGANIAGASLAMWYIHCEADDPGPCEISTPQNWVANINANNPGVAPQLTQLIALTAPPPPDPLMRCNGFNHDTWTTIYNANFRFNGTNLYEWFIQYQRSALPVVMKSFNARLQHGKVLIEWVTSSEVDANHFIVERAGPDQRFSELATLKASGNSAADKAYAFTDDRPLEGLSYYRLVQTDVDGGKHYFRTAKILNRSSKQVIIVAPNPFSIELSVYLLLRKRQQVTIVIADANGRVVQSMSRIYNEGNTELPVNTTHLSKGVYFLRAEGEGFSETHKLIRQ